MPTRVENTREHAKRRDRLLHARATAIRASRARAPSHGSCADRATCRGTEVAPALAAHLAVISEHDKRAGVRADR